MSSTEWGILLGVLFSIAAPTVTAWVSLFVKVAAIQTEIHATTATMAADLVRRDKEHGDALEQIRQLWARHNSQESRIFVHEQTLARLAEHTQLPTITGRPPEFVGDRKPGH